jgi:hypothetical protein
MASKFLWMRSTYGLPEKDHIERRNMYSTDIDYIQIQYARPAITAFSAQLVKLEERLIREAKNTVKKDGGLHAFTTGKKERSSRYDLGANSFQEASKIFQEKTPLAIKPSRLGNLYSKPPFKSLEQIQYKGTLSSEQLRSEWASGPDDEEY